MSNYNFSHVFSEIRNSNFENKDEGCSNYRDYLKKYNHIVNPDFIVVIDLKSDSPIVFQKNYGLKFNGEEPILLKDIIQSVPDDQLVKIVELDKEILKYSVEKGIDLLKQSNIYTIAFDIFSKRGTYSKLIRNVVVLSMDELGVPDIVLADFSMATQLHKNNMGVNAMVKGFNNLKIDTKDNLFELNEKLKSIVATNINITKREKEILDLISKGKTSREIGCHLNISIKTVNTHRQNLIKKNNVNNISALLGKL